MNAYKYINRSREVDAKSESQDEDASVTIRLGESELQQLATLALQFKMTED